MLKRLRYDIQAIRQRDPAARSSAEVFLLYAGLHALIWYRAAHFFYCHKRFFLARLLSQWGRFWTGIEIHPGAEIGRGLLIDHGAGVVIGETAVIGDDCTIYQGVTLGGTGKEHGKRHPTLGNNVMVGAGAKILGPFRVGDNSRIAAGAVVLEEIPPQFHRSGRACPGGSSERAEGLRRHGSDSRAGSRLPGDLPPENPAGAPGQGAGRRSNRKEGFP